MSLKKLYTSGALGLMISVLPVVTQAQSAHSDTPEGAIFVPIVAECVNAPSEDTCGQVRAVLTECAEEFEYATCDVLFVDSTEVFDTPALKDRVEIMLADTGALIAAMEFDEAHNGDIADLVDVSRADAERTMLRGDENLNSHSSPALIVDD
ncbi:MAG: hypothetical protein IIX61_08225 [Loktanella sp.]|nr:hypothetical protein [Loktanella sp.]